MNKHLSRSPHTSTQTPSTTFPTVPLKEVPRPTSSSETYRPVVLVVDDESTIADTLTEILKLRGFAAMAAYDGESALESALLMPPELLISDVILPGMSGIDLAIAMRRIFPDCKVLLFSGQASTSDLLVAASKQGHHFSLLTKPIHPTELLARVSEAFRSRPQSKAANVA
jgi:DNA-binding response OmpR family regulator